MSKLTFCAFPGSLKIISVRHVSSLKIATIPIKTINSDNFYHVSQKRYFDKILSHLSKMTVQRLLLCYTCQVVKKPVKAINNLCFLSHSPKTILEVSCYTCQTRQYEEYLHYTCRQVSVIEKPSAITYCALPVVPAKKESILCHTYQQWQLFKYYLHYTSQKNTLEISVIPIKAVSSNISCLSKKYFKSIMSHL